MFDDIVKKTNGQLEAIIIFDFSTGSPSYHSSTDPVKHKILFRDNDIGVAFRDFENLKVLKPTLDSFGENTKSGSLQYSIFKLEARQLMIYFYDLPDTTVAICFIALTDVPIDQLVDLCQNNINKIKNKLNKG